MLDSEGYEAVYLSDGDEVAAPDLGVRARLDPACRRISRRVAGSICAERCAKAIRAVTTQCYSWATTTEEQSAARGLLAGADDFMAHPIRELELRARIRVQLRNKRFYEAIERLRDERDSLRRDAQIDPLTNVLNRRSLEATMRQRCQLRERFGVLFVDLDHFKQVNDRFGHDTGDRVLIAVASVIKSGLRPGDIIGRYGGEEFVAIVAGAGPESARLVAERLRRAVEEMVPPSPGPSGVTISIGTTVFDPRQLEETPQELVHRADLALYAAKRGGRNRVVMVPSGETLPELESKESLSPPRPSVPSPPDLPILITWGGRSG